MRVVRINAHFYMKFTVTIIILFKYDIDQIQGVLRIYKRQGLNFKGSVKQIASAGTVK